MSEHLIQLWVSSDSDPEDLDWQQLLPSGFQLTHAQVKTFPWSDVEHEVVWWITRRLTTDEWNNLDNAESEVLARIVGDGNFQGMAGPIPDETGSETDTAP